MARALFRVKKYKKAIPHFRKLHSRAPRATGPFWYLATIYAMKKKLRKVKRLTAARLLSMPSDLLARKVLCRAWAFQRDFEQAHDALEPSVKAGKADANLYNLRAWLWLFRRKFDAKAAIADAAKANRMTSSSVQSYLGTLAAVHAEAGKLKEFKHCSKDYAFENADFVLSAAPPAWKRILTKKDKFVGAFMGGRVKLEKGDTVGALALGPHANTLVDVLTQVELKFPDDLTPEDLEAFKKELAQKRVDLGI